MDARVAKLGIKLGDTRLAEILVGAGLDTPAKIKAAGDDVLLALPGVGDKALGHIRERCPRAEREP